jgi:DNA-binding response OmpR family regulator
MTPSAITATNAAKALTCNGTCPGSSTKAAKKKILVVDDDPHIRDSLHKVMDAEGYEVVLASNGQEGIKYIYADRIDLLLLDVSLPDISGWDVFGTITSINPFLPIIIITGRDDQHDLATLGGVGALIEKPLDVPQLLETVKELLAESPEVHLQRLVGLHTNLHHVQPTHLDS